MIDETRREQGMRARRQVLGDEHVNRAIERTTTSTADFQDFITRTAWGDIWSRPGLDLRSRSVAVLSSLIALGRYEEFAIHVRAAARNGLTGEEIIEVILQAANNAFTIAQPILDAQDDDNGEKQA